MTDTIVKAGDTVHQLISQKGVQALVTVIVTCGMIGMLILGITPPEYLIYAWFMLLGVYVELPGKNEAV